MWTSVLCLASWMTEIQESGVKVRGEFMGLRVKKHSLLASPACFAGNVISEKKLITFRITGILTIYLTRVLVNDVKWTISGLSLESSCPGCIHDISVVVGSSLSEKPMLSCALCSMKVMDFRLRWSKSLWGFVGVPFWSLVSLVSCHPSGWLYGFPKLSDLQLILHCFPIPDGNMSKICHLDRDWTRVRLSSQSYWKQWV